MSDYRPIRCDFHDELLLRAMRGLRCEIRYRDESGDEVRSFDVIEDVFTRAGGEFLRLREGIEIRLDRLVAVDGVAP